MLELNLLTRGKEGISGRCWLWRHAIKRSTKNACTKPEAASPQLMFGVQTSQP